MLGFLFKVAAGTAKRVVKYVIVPAIVSVGIALAAEAIAERIRAHTPDAANGVDHRRPRKAAAQTA